MCPFMCFFIWRPLHIIGKIHPLLSLLLCYLYFGAFLFHVISDEEKEFLGLRKNCKAMKNIILDLENIVYSERKGEEECEREGGITEKTSKVINRRDNLTKKKKRKTSYKKFKRKKGCCDRISR